MGNLREKIVFFTAILHTNAGQRELLIAIVLLENLLFGVWTAAGPAVAGDGKFINICPCHLPLPELASRSTRRSCGAVAAASRLLLLSACEHACGVAPRQLWRGAHVGHAGIVALPY